MIPIHFQCTGNKFIGEEIWNLSCHKVYSCHMSSKFQDMLKWEINNEKRLFGEGEKALEEFSLLFLFLPLIIIIAFLFFFLRNTIFFFFMVAPVVTMIWYIFPHVNTFDKITLTDSDLSLIYVQIILYTSFWVK